LDLFGVLLLRWLSITAEFTETQSNAEIYMLGH
jgi:hypothetical protein